MMRILVADDDRVSRIMLGGVLTKWGHQTVLANDGGQAWHLLQQKDAPRLAILDWMMPQMDGVEVCTKLRETPSTTPTYVILCTSRDDTSDVVAGLDAGANDYVVKPFEADELRARLAVGERVVALQDEVNMRVQQLEAALNQVKQLEGFIRICMHCHRIHNDSDVWEQLELYLGEHSSATFSHGLCPECLSKYYPE